MSSAQRRKVSSMGKSGSGKTSMRSVIFSNYTAKDTRRLGATIDVEQSAVRLLGSLVSNSWDCGGQDAFSDNYSSAQRDTIFSNVAVLIYVFDMTSTEWEKDSHYFEDNSSASRENSPDAGVWVSMNKMDLVDSEDPKRTKYQERRDEVSASNEKSSKDVDGAGGCRCFPTSIWDESSYKAWSNVIHTQIPNIKSISAHLTYLRDMSGAAEIAAFESETFLIMAKSGSPSDSDSSEADDVEKAKGVPGLDPERFEKISEIVKSFRKTCQKTGEQFYGFDAQFDGVTVVLEPMTRNTFAMVVGVDPTVEAGLVKYNMNQARSHLAEVGTMTTMTRKCGVCEHNVKLEHNISYKPSNPSGRAWDDVGIDVPAAA